MKPSSTRSLLPGFAAVTIAFALSACAGEQKHADAASNAPATTTPPAPPNTPTASNVAISLDILHACHISADSAYFAFDAANVTVSDRSTLKQVVECFKNGALTGRSMKLIGRADPRGMSDYNMTLGQSRADAVAGYMGAQGLSHSRTLTTSRGAMDAEGTNGPGWAKDRRVDVLLAD